MQKQSQFTEGRIFIPLIRFAVPVFAAICLQAMYGAVDLLVVGQFSDAANVSAVSTGSQMMHTITMVITALAMAATIMLGQAIGSRKTEEGAGLLEPASLFSGLSPWF